jgi:hypothetical protein
MLGERVQTNDRQVDHFSVCIAAESNQRTF